MRQLGQAMILLGLITGVDGIGLLIAYRNLTGVAFIALPILLVLIGFVLIKRATAKP
jgi:hypothetical protein